MQWVNMCHVTEIICKKKAIMLISHPNFRSKGNIHMENFPKNMLSEAQNKYYEVFFCIVALTAGSRTASVNSILI